MSATVADLSVEQLEALLAEKKKDQQAETIAKRKAYEKRRESVIDTLGGWAENVSNSLSQLKAGAFDELSAFRNEMLEYGELRGGERNKGSFEIKNDNYKIQFRSQINKQFDERAELAETKLKAFLKSFVRKRDQKMYAMLQALLERNTKTGDFDINLINRLYQLEDQFDDPNWKDAIRLFKESYSPSGTAQYVRFSVMGANGNWVAIPLDFTASKAKPTATAEEVDNE